VGVVVECKRGITFRRVCLFHMSTMLLSNISEGERFTSEPCFHSLGMNVTFNISTLTFNVPIERLSCGNGSGGRILWFARDLRYYNDSPLKPIDHTV
jgi:hypothetical protein